MVKGRKSGNTKAPSPLRQNRMFCALNLCQDATLYRSTKLKPSLLPFKELITSINHLSTDSGYDNHSCINFPFHCALNQVDLSTNLLDKEILFNQGCSTINQKTKERRPAQINTKEKWKQKEITLRNQEIQECE